MLSLNDSSLVELSIQHNISRIISLTKQELIRSKLVNLSEPLRWEVDFTKYLNLILRRYSCKEESLGSTDGNFIFPRGLLNAVNIIDLLKMRLANIFEIVIYGGYNINIAIILSTNKGSVIQHAHAKHWILYRHCSNNFHRLGSQYGDIGVATEKNQVLVYIWTKYVTKLKFLQICLGFIVINVHHFIQEWD